MKVGPENPAADLLSHLEQVMPKRRPRAQLIALLVRRFRRERGDDFLETRVAAERVPLRIKA